ncbi:exo 1,3/1,4-beta-D-glucan glucohydrolase [Caulobacter sp. BP25]|uniref:glycoside hydrolase family 3 protein n=1 Tax=Caulobacter sp. BP25 TaxID=2048900 RepID=UPI000C12D83A|nr:exo 1,3/1,4-beta-D-glucan glucohydrolase [Caulobacter sp. BP25]PHY22273.1 1,4-beta-D-glucan glucohydrolase [Caulobacter sp. BP25]
MFSRRSLRVSFLALAIAGGFSGAVLAQTPSGAATTHPELWPKTSSPATITDAKAEAFVTQLMGQMSVEDKVAQTIQADGASITPEELKKYRLGSVLVGGNSAPDGNDRASAQRWIEWTNAFRAAALESRGGHQEIPIIFGVDAVHGHNNVVGATIFPHNIGLGAARDPDLIRRIGEATAKEMAATGADWTFGPTVAVPRDVRWGRTYEGYAEDPEVVKTYAGPMTLGLQGALVAGKPLATGHIAGSAKHFLGDGGTDGGKDQGDAQLPEAELIRLHNAGYPPAIEAGILSVMVSFSSWNGVKHTGNKGLLTDVLKGRLGFEGFVVGDWNAHGQVEGCTNTSCAQAYNAGMDMMMAPDSWKGLYDNTLAQVKAGQIPMARIDDAVRRILRVKVKAGLFENKRPLEGKLELLGAPEHRAIAREAVRKSLVLLKNEGVLPLKSSARVLVAGDGADDIGKASGGWTLTWQGTGNKNSDFPNGQSIFGGIAEAVKAGGGSAELSVSGDYKQKPDVAIVVFGENPYAEFQGDIATAEYQPGDKTDLALLKKLKAQGIPVVSVFLSGRPLWTNPEINASDAFVAAWLPGSEGGGVADVLIGDKAGKPRFDFKGKLSFSWPKRADQEPINVGDKGYDPLFAYGYGLSYAKPGKVAVLSEESGVTSAAATNVDRYFIAGRAPAPWLLTTSGAVTTKAIDAGAQENARQAVWTGEGQGLLGVSGRPVDLSRQTTGDMAVMLRYRVDASPEKPVSMAIGCGESCGATVDVTSTFSGAKIGEWRTAKIKLSCFKAKGADMARVTAPFALMTSGRMSMTFTEIRLASNEGDAVCPAN